MMKSMQATPAILFDAKQKRFASKTLYLLLSFPLSLISFILIVTFFSISVSTIIIWIGLPLLLLTLGMVRIIASIERDMAIGLLGVNIPVREPRDHSQLRLGTLFRVMLQDSATWKSLLYIFIKFPLSIFSFCITLTLSLTTLALLLLPLTYIILTLVFQANGIHIANQIPAMWQMVTLQITGEFTIQDLLKSILYGVSLGLLFWFVSRVVINGLAWISGEIARVLLGTPMRALPKTEHYNVAMPALLPTIQPGMLD
ncbi:sensor domain-containing protein [Dictyobacter arantiisoli]|uniref:Putative sensor domain-containing protein n=1 Tax=Dictyobacter arantiisoli TaxID=2014874 RepID=A0A5A5TF67_9CHLR|nr:sensor domain-containing protein [Dictyobacter arantiisoli]GCF10062.1 hypothetical protein KDI_36260 [Dictyobacter arantiisoli]